MPIEASAYRRTKKGGLHADRSVGIRTLANAYRFMLELNYMQIKRSYENEFITP
ncbi:MAG: hypothetical protein IPQ02_11640 [Saprospiraceae bacterium]|nr:hypothetical protein [Candidatus Defluviibacterium haderslevense]